MVNSDDFFIRRRRIIRAIASIPALGVFGCATVCRNHRSEIGEELPSGLEQILRPANILKGGGAPSLVVDVHAHFFNARDVPIRGYLAGPVAHSKEGVIGELLRAIAPVAEWIADEAPRASDEFHELVALANSGSFLAMSHQERTRKLDQQRDQYLHDLSVRLYEQLRAVPDFVRLYNTSQTETQSRIRTQGVGAPLLDEGSLFRAMQSDLQPQAMDIELFGAVETLPPYADGVLAFIGYMMSYRWMNLLAYQRA